MSSLSSEKSTQLLGAFASVLGVLSLFLYFTAWIYRWSYFAYYSLELNQLSFPFRSFFFVPIQVFLGDLGAFLKTILALILIAIAIKSTLWLLQALSLKFKLLMQSFQPINPREEYYLKGLKVAQFIHQSLLLNLIRNLVSVIPTALRKDLIIVLWLLMILFWLARNQGWEDAKRDANVDSRISALPVFTYVFPEDKLGMGRKLEEIDISIAFKGYGMIGDPDLFFKGLLNQEINDPTSSPPRVWRLLLETNNWIYCFPALSSDEINNKQVPPVLAIRKDKEGQFLILAPSTSQ
jgi:hypothetical protein